MILKCRPWSSACPLWPSACFTDLLLSRKEGAQHATSTSIRDVGAESNCSGKGDKNQCGSARIDWFSVRRETTRTAFITSDVFDFMARASRKPPNTILPSLHFFPSRCDRNLLFPSCLPWHSKQQSARERAALWLAVNKLDVLEAAKDAAIKELQVCTLLC